MKRAAGLLLYRPGPEGLEVLLVHSSGNYNRGKPWSIPKGEPDPDDVDLEATAKRETREETGVDVISAVRPLGSMKYKKSGKEIHAFAAPAPPDAAPCCACWEIDQACFLPLAQARQHIHPDQAIFLDRLEELLSNQES